MCNRLTRRRHSDGEYRPNSKIDYCIRNLIAVLGIGSIQGARYKPVASCCGHSRYPLTIVMYDKVNREYFELLTNTVIPRKRNFYKSDGRGYYYIPEVSKERVGR